MEVSKRRFIARNTRKILTTMYNEHTLTDMNQLHLIIDDEMAKVLNTYPNKSNVVREAIAMYIEGTTTDTLKNMRVAFLKQTEEMTALAEKMDKLLSQLEERSY